MTEWEAEARAQFQFFGEVISYARRHVELGSLLLIAQVGIANCLDIQRSQRQAEEEQAKHRVSRTGALPQQ